MRSTMDYVVTAAIVLAIGGFGYYAWWNGKRLRAEGIIKRKGGRASHAGRRPEATIEVYS